LSGTAGPARSASPESRVKDARAALDKAWVRLWSAAHLRGSVLVYLMCLSVVPMLGLGGFATVLVHQSQDQAAAVRRLEAGMHTVERLDTLRLSLLKESTSSVAAVLAAQLGVSVGQLTLLSGIDLEPVPAARARTDAVLRALVGDASVAAPAAELGGQLTRLRQAAEGASASSASSAPDQMVALEQYGALMTRAEELEMSASQALSGGRYGRGSVALSEAAGELTAVTVLGVYSGRRATALYVAHNSGRAAAAVSALREADAAHRSVSALVGKALTGELAARWRAVSTSSTAKQLTALVASNLAPSAAGRKSSPFSPVALQVGQAVAGTYAEQQPVLALAVARGVAAARADRTAATDHTRNVVLAALGTTVLTTVLLFLVGGAVRHRLNLLAEAAHDLSSGRLTTVELRGPREIAVAGRGLTDASRSLERVLLSAERLAAGDLTAAELSRPLEGRLGAAVTAAFGQVTEAMEERERLQRRLAHQATHDVLTGLPNRGAAQDLLEAVVREVRGGAAVAVLFIDLDRFKVLNDTYGHAAGDHVLQVCAARMSTQLRSEDTLCRLGGDEFVVVLLGGRADAAVVGERIVAALAEPIPWHEHVFAIGASVGVAVAAPGDTADGLLARADHAVYRAKAQGRGTVRFADQPDHTDHTDVARA
jgi:diguanylate cyclase (GGDEF)-like protein